MPELAFTTQTPEPQEFVPESLRLQREIEEDLVASGRNSLASQVFADQTTFWAEDYPEQRTKLMWHIWDNMVWTPGYGSVYADTKKQIRSWLSAIVRDARSNYVKEHGYGKMIQDSGNIKQQELENLPKRMAVLQLRAWVSASRRGKDLPNICRGNNGACCARNGGGWNSCDRAWSHGRC